MGKHTSNVGICHDSVYYMILIFGFPAKSEHPEKYTFACHSWKVDDQSEYERFINKDQGKRREEGAGQRG